MKKSWTILALGMLLSFGGCSDEYDDSNLINRMDNLENQFNQLQNLCNQMNANISSLQTIVNALKERDAITQVSPVIQGNKIIGYTLSFEKNSPITIYHGEKGEQGEPGVNGQDGKPGVDGQDGKDGQSPVIGVKKDTDGIYYWTLNGEWLTDANGAKICAEGKHGADGEDGKPGVDGQNGITPKLKIEGGYWYVSYDNELSWVQLSKAIVDPMDNAFFQKVTQDDQYLYMTLKDGSEIKLPKKTAVAITFSDYQHFNIVPKQVYTINYTLTGATPTTFIKVLAQDGYQAVVKTSTKDTGVIEVRTPASVIPTDILVFVLDGENLKLTTTIELMKNDLKIQKKTYTIGYEGGKVVIPFEGDKQFQVQIATKDQSWIQSVNDATLMSSNQLAFQVSNHTGQTPRFATITLKNTLNNTQKTVNILQCKDTDYLEVQNSQAGNLYNITVHIENPTLFGLTITGSLNQSDIQTIRKFFPNLKYLDIHGVINKELPGSCFKNSMLEFVALPQYLTAVPDSAFYMSQLCSMEIPPYVETLGNYAYYKCKNIHGDIRIPDATRTVGKHCFHKSTFDGYCDLGKNIEIIGDFAFGADSGLQLKGELVLPKKLKSIRSNAFQGTTLSGVLTIPASVEYIGQYTFLFCNNFTALRFEEGSQLRTIDLFCFMGSENMKGNLIIPKHVHYIGSMAFSGCTGFDGYLSIGENVKYIGSNAFGDYSPNKKLLNFSKVYSQAPIAPKLDNNTIPVFNMHTKYLGIPKGSRDSYKDWNTTFSTIEEIDFANAKL